MLPKAPFVSLSINRRDAAQRLKMFSDHTSAATEFPSSWRQTRSVKEGGCQTERQETREATAQSTLYDEAGTQTEERMAVRLNTKGLLSEFSPFPLRVPLPYSAIMDYGVHCAFRRVFLTFLNMHACIQPQNEGSRVDVTKHLNAPSLIKFLSRAAPLIEYELAAAARSRAFDGYALIEEEAERQVSFIENARAAGSRSQCASSHFGDFHK